MYLSHSHKKWLWLDIRYFCCKKCQQKSRFWRGNIVLYRINLFSENFDFVWVNSTIYDTKICAGVLSKVAGLLYHMVVNSSGDHISITYHISDNWKYPKSFNFAATHVLNIRIRSNLRVAQNGRFVIYPVYPGGSTLVAKILDFRLFENLKNVLSKTFCSP